jgi:hypothetical protein
MSRRRVAVIAAAVLVAAGCSGSSAKGAPVAPGPTATKAPPGPARTSPPTTQALRPGQTRHHVGAVFEYGSFLVTIGESVYDASTKTLALGVRYSNLGGQWHDFLAQGTVTDGSFQAPLLSNTGTVPARLFVDTTVTAEGFDHDPTATGTVTWGRPDRDTPIIHLADGHVDGGWLPTPVAIDTWGSQGKYTVHVTGAKVLSGFPATDVQADPGSRVLHLDFDEWAAHQDPVNGFYPVEHLTLQRPDGTTVETDQSSDGIAPVSWTALAGQWIEFPVAADPAGDYRLLLTSLSTKGMSTFHPELLEKASLSFTIPKVASAGAPTDPVPGPSVDLTALGAVPPAATALDLALTVNPINVPGFTFAPQHLHWDPAAKTAELTGAASLIEANDNTAPADATSAPGAAASLLDAPPVFDFSVVLASQHRMYTGTIDPMDPIVAGKPAPVTIRFDLVDRLDAADVSLAMGSNHSNPSTLPLVPGGALPQYPPDPRDAAVTDPTVTAGVWSIHVVSYRVGRLLGSTPPPPGQLDLEFTVDVTIAPNAPPKALGLSFRPSVQVFLARSDGYLQQAIADGGLVQFQPGETHRERVLFHVPDAFRPGPMGVVLRGGDETADVTTDVFPETTFTAVLAGLTTGGL